MVYGMTSYQKMYIPSISHLAFIKIAGTNFPCRQQVDQIGKVKMSKFRKNQNQFSKTKHFESRSTKEVKGLIISMHTNVGRNHRIIRRVSTTCAFYGSLSDIHILMLNIMHYVLHSVLVTYNIIQDLHYICIFYLGIQHFINMQVNI